MEREAAVRLTLDSGQYLTNIRKLGDANEQAMQRSNRAAQAFSAGLGRAKDTLVSMGSQLKQTVTMAAGLGGAFAFGNLARDAVSMQSRLQDLAIRLQLAGKGTGDWRDIQKQIEPIALKNARSTAELAEAYADLVDETGDA